MPDNTSITIKDGTLGIGGSAFFGCKGLTSIIIPNSVTNIGEEAFYGCSGLTSITIPDSVTIIGADAFYNCEKSKSIYYTGDIASWCGIGGLESLTKSSSHALYFGGERLWGDLVIPDSVTSIGSYAFCNSDLISITIPRNVTNIGEGAFSGCSMLTTIIVEESNTRYHSAGNCLIETESKTLIAGCQKSDIPDDGSVTRIGNAAFYGCIHLSSITIPTSVREIGEYAFGKCKSLYKITFKGTKAQWNAISKSNNWKRDSVTYQVICTDGTI